MDFTAEVITPEMLERLESIEEKLDEVKTFMVRHEKVLVRLERLEKRAGEVERNLEILKVRVWGIGVTAGAIVATAEFMLRYFMQ